MYEQITNFIREKGYVTLNDLRARFKLTYSAAQSYVHDIAIAHADIEFLDPYCDVVIDVNAKAEYESVMAQMFPPEE